jgi:hypothetical protein
MRRQSIKGTVLGHTLPHMTVGNRPIWAYFDTLSTRVDGMQSFSVDRTSREMIG